MESTMRNGDGRELQQHAAGRSSYWDPFGILTGIAAWWDPLGVLRPLTLAHTFVPAFDGRDTGDAYVLEADLPGIQESELEMSVTGNRLSVSGKRESRQQEKDGRYFCSERAYGTFIRTFTLPDDAELGQVNAEFRDGVLRVKIPKRPEAQTHRIALTGARSDGNGGQRQRAGGGQQQAGASRPASDAEQPPEPTTASRRTKGSPARRLGTTPTRPGR
jgi:HSP20 family protein